MKNTKENIINLIKTNDVGSLTALLKSDKKTWSFYNSANRASFGFGLFRLRQQTALQSRLAWNWNQNAGNPYFALDAREDDVNWCNSLRSGDLQCTVFLRRHILEGLNDYRLALLLKKTAFKNKAYQKMATQLLNDITENAPLSTEPIVGSTISTYDREELWRTDILSLFDKMTEEINVKAQIK